jgi:hypothetical protein
LDPPRCRITSEAVHLSVLARPGGAQVNDEASITVLIADYVFRIVGRFPATTPRFL